MTPRKGLPLTKFPRRSVGRHLGPAGLTERVATGRWLGQTRELDHIFLRAMLVRRTPSLKRTGHQHPVWGIVHFTD